MDPSKRTQPTGGSIGIGAGLGAGLGLVLSLLVGSELALGLALGAGVWMLEGPLLERLVAAHPDT